MKILHGYAIGAKIKPGQDLKYHFHLSVKLYFDCPLIYIQKYDETKANP
jgi:hypothetical protein